MGENQRTVFVKNLQRIMDVRKITQADIVIAVGVSSSTVSDWVNGKKYPRVDVLQKLADYLGVLPSDLQSDDGAAEIDVRTPDEDELLAIYRDLNPTGQITLLNVARGLAANPDMKRGGESRNETA